MRVRFRSRPEAEGSKQRATLSKDIESRDYGPRSGGPISRARWVGCSDVDEKEDGEAGRETESEIGWIR